MNDAMDPEELLERASALERGPEQVSLIEEALKLADLRRDEDLGYRARTELIEAGTFAGFPEKVLVAFTWCLARCDRDPERFDEFDLLWQYKWVALHLPNFPQIPRAKLEEVFQDMEQRYTRSGRNLRPVHKLRWIMHRDMGEPEAALQAWRAARRLPRDYGADCPACERNDEVAYHLFRGQPKQAIATALPLLSGLESCASVPEVTFARVLRPLLSLGRREEAERYHRQGYPRVRGDRGFLSALGDHLAYAAITSDFPRAREVLSESLRMVLETSDKQEAFAFLCAAVVWADAELAAGSARVPLTLPAQVPGRGEEGYDLGALAPWLEARAAELAARFDARNGTPHHAERLAQDRAEARALRSA